MAKRIISYRGRAKAPAPMVEGHEPVSTWEPRSGVWGWLGRLAGFPGRRRRILQRDLSQFSNQSEEWQTAHEEMFRSVGTHFDNNEAHIKDAGHLVAGNFQHFLDKAAEYEQIAQEFQRQHHVLQERAYTDLSQRFKTIGERLQTNPDMFKKAVKEDVGALTDKGARKGSKLISTLYGKTGFWGIRNKNLRSIFNNHPVDAGTALLEIYQNPHHATLRDLMTELKNVHGKLGRLHPPERESEGEE